MLRAQSYATIGIIPGPEYQAIRTALLVIDVSELPGVAPTYDGGCHADGSHRGRSYATGSHGSRTFNYRSRCARQATTAIIAT
jgi:hypothetical protein